MEVSEYNKTADIKIVPRINPPPGCCSDGSLRSPQESEKEINDSEIKRPLTAYSIFAQQVNYDFNITFFIDKAH